MATEKRDRRTYVREMYWALNQASARGHDRNPNRHAQVQAALDYGMSVYQAKLGKEPIPPRPDIDNCA